MVLIADAGKGIVWRLDAWTGDYNLAIQDDLFNANNPKLPLGVDGPRRLGDELYFTNPGSSFFGKVAINAWGNATGPVEVFANLTFPDDFALAPDGTAYVVGANTLTRVSPDGSLSVLAGGINDTVLEGATSAQLGRTSDDAGVLYISKPWSCSSLAFAKLNGRYQRRTAGPGRRSYHWRSDLSHQRRPVLLEYHSTGGRCKTFGVGVVLLVDLSY